MVNTPFLDHYRNLGIFTDANNSNNQDFTDITKRLTNLENTVNKQQQKDIIILGIANALQSDTSNNFTTFVDTQGNVVSPDTSGSTLAFTGESIFNFMTYSLERISKLENTVKSLETLIKEQELKDNKQKEEKDDS